MGPQDHTGVPPWNVDMVLLVVGAPFKPLHYSSLWLFDPENSFLVALETAKRIGELQVLSAYVACYGNDMVLSYFSDFVVKMETPATCFLGKNGNDSIRCRNSLGDIAPLRLTGKCCISHWQLGWQGFEPRPPTLGTRDLTNYVTQPQRSLGS